MKSRLLIVLLLTAALTGCGKKEVKTEATEEKVSESTASTEGVTSGTLKLSKNEFYTTEDIKVDFTAEGDVTKNAWVGLIPSSTPHGDENVNDANDISWKYVTEKSGVLNFTAPLKPGDYDFRMNSSDNNGKEVTSVTFKVVANPSDTVISISLNKDSYKPGEEITLNFRAIPGWDATAWIGLIPADVKHGTEADNDANDLAYQYISNKSNGTMTFTAPEKPGKYDFRMMTSDNTDAKEVKYVTFIVK